MSTVAGPNITLHTVLIVHLAAWQVVRQIRFYFCKEKKNRKMHRSHHILLLFLANHGGEISNRNSNSNNSSSKNKSK